MFCFDNSIQGAIGELATHAGNHCSRHVSGLGCKERPVAARCDPDSFGVEDTKSPELDTAFHSTSIQSTRAQRSETGTAALAPYSCTTLAQEKAAVSRVHASPLQLLGFWDRGSRKLSKERATVWDAIMPEFG